MTESDRAALKRLLGSEGSRGATTDDLQGLLLQVVFALLMVFMIAYFIFVETSRKERAEEIIEVNRQKLILAIDKVAEDHRVKYGLNALMTQGTDGRRSFDADEHVKGGRIELAPAAKAAFASGSAAAFADYRDTAALATAWKSAVLEEAKLEETALTDDEKTWLGNRAGRRSCGRRSRPGDGTGREAGMDPEAGAGRETCGRAENRFDRTAAGESSYSGDRKNRKEIRTGRRAEKI